MNYLEMLIQQFGVRFIAALVIVGILIALGCSHAVGKSPPD